MSRMPRSLFAISAVFVTLLSLTTGCASQPARPAAAPTEAAQEVDPSSDPSFTPPDESGVAFVDKPAKQKSLGERSERNEKNAPVRNLPSANAQKPAAGALHPATH